MLKLTRWCIAHRRVVFVGWVAIAVVTTALAQSVGRQYANNFTLPGTESQRALDLLTRDFPQQGGDRDEIVFHTAVGTVDSAAVRAAMSPALERVHGFPHVVGVTSPYTPAGALG